MDSALHAHLKSHVPEYKSNNLSRLSYLYSNFFLSRISNPTSFASALDFWKSTLLSCLPVLSNDHLVLHANSSLLDQFRWENTGRPSALGGVILELAASQQLIPLKTFLSSDTPFKPISEAKGGSETWSRWVARNVVGKPFWWTLRQTGLIGDEEDDVSKERLKSSQQIWKEASGDWVAFEALQSAASEIMEQYNASPNLSLTDRLYSFDLFQSTFASTYSELDLTVLLKYLSRDSKVLLFDSKGKIIKFLSSPYAVQAPKESITETDIGIIEIFSTRKLLQSQITDIEKRIKEKQERVEESVKAKRKDVALTHLKARKALDELLSKRTTSLTQLEGIILSIETAASDIEIMRSYNTASTTLKSLLSSPELQRENVESTLDNLGELMADQKEITDTIASAGKIDMDLSEDELEKELAGLVETSAADKERKKGAEQLQELKVPVSEPKNDQDRSKGITTQPEAVAAE